RDIPAKGGAVLVVTHFMDEAEQLCDRVAVVDRGCLVALDRPAALGDRATLGRAGGQARPGGVVPPERREARATGAPIGRAEGKASLEDVSLALPGREAAP